MAEYVVVYEHHNIQRIQAETVEHEPEDHVYVFRDEERKIVAWVRDDEVRAVALRSAIGNP